MEFLTSLIIVSEKAANIARIIRRNEHLFDLLVQKKKSSEANPRFVEDFKTLADVLIQEMVKHDLQKQFPDLTGNINGEENNVFRNTLGEEICVEVESCAEDTSALLEKVLNGDQVAAKLLAAEVHRTIDIEEVNTRIPDKQFHLDLKQMGIWIDPIDCTAEYVSGGKGNLDNGVSLNGLKCVTILIGAFNRNDGEATIGVINRPFVDEEDLSSNYQCLWGVSLSKINFNEHCVQKSNERKNVICLSSSESPEIKQKLQAHHFHLVEASGAGYKLLTVITGLADAYILTKGTTFKWDTCSPHAILKSLGGDVLDFRDAIKDKQEALQYSSEVSICNTNGLIAYKNPGILMEIFEILRDIY